MNKKTAQQEKFINWLSLSEDERDPKDLSGWCILNKISKPTVYKWKKEIEGLRNNGGGGGKFGAFLKHLEAEVFKVGCPTPRQELYRKLMGWGG